MCSRARRQTFCESPILVLVTYVRGELNGSDTNDAFSNRVAISEAANEQKATRLTVAAQLPDVTITLINLKNVDTAREQLPRRLGRQLLHYAQCKGRFMLMSFKIHPVVMYTGRHK